MKQFPDNLKAKDDGGNTVDVLAYPTGHLHLKNLTNTELLERILYELQKANLYLSIVTGEHISSGDVEV